ncbi:MAG: T9SS type A sorting domain-containing protein [Bacteroidetes bacterium]|nr:T9SS type A sorting domain-containing protein [Bacteroidota bacterium]
MKKILPILFFFVCLSSSYSQTNSVQLFPGGTFYNSITAAYAAITGAAPITQAYTIELQSIYDGSTETFPVTLALVGGVSASNTITIRPAAGVSSLLISSNQAGFGTFDLNGANYIIIDGRAGGTGTSKNLTIRNTSNSTTVGTSTIRLQNDACYNVIKYCVLQGSAKDGNSGTGIVQFGTTTGTLGNSNNYVTRNLMQDDPTNVTDLPNYCVAANGNTSTGTGLNSNNMVTNNELTNFFNRGFSMFGLNGNNWNIDSNFVYRNSYTKASGATNCLSILTAITGWTMNFNTIAGPTPADTFYMGTGNQQWTGIVSTNGGTGFISGNTISKIRMISTTAGTGINVGGTGANITVSGNTISDVIQRNTGEVRGIVSSAPTVSIIGNSINNLQCTNATGTNNNIRGIFHSGTASTATIMNNTLNNFVTSGINTTFNATNANPLNGIFVGTADSCAIYNNSISGLNMTSTTAINTTAFGIGATNSAKTYIGNNYIADINNLNTGATSRAGGILIYNATNRQWITNNIVSMGYNTTNALNVHGILHFNTAAQTGPLYVSFNSVYISGTASGTAASFGFQRVRETPIELKGNILYNIRTGGTGGHFAVSVINSTLNWTAGNINNNNIYSATSGTVGQWLAASFNFPDWITTSGGDGSSISGTPLYHSVTNLNLLPNTPCYGGASTLSYVLTDYYGVTRSLITPTIGAVEVVSFQPPANQSSLSSPTTGADNVILSLAGAGGLSVNPSAISPASATITGQYFSSGSTGSNPGVTNRSRYYWTVSTDAGSFSGSVRFYFNNIPSNGVLVPGTLKLLRRSGPSSSWSVWPTTTNTATYIEATGLTGFSEFALGGDIDNPLPVELTNFSAIVNNRDVNLSWKTSSEQNNSGFDIERRTQEGEWNKIGYVQGRGSSNTENSYNYADKNLNKGTYSYRLKQIDFNGSFKYYNLNTNVSVGVPAKFELSQNYPNPFNPSTKINFSLPKDAKVTLTIFDISGREVARLLNGEFRQADYYTVNFNGSALASGVYFYKIQAGDFTESKKMMLVK